MDITQIDTRIGSKSDYYFSHGNTLPLIGTPFAMNYLSVQTNQDNSWWFNPDEYTFKGIRLTHQPSPWIGDFQHFLFKIKTRANFDDLDDYNRDHSLFRPDYLAIENISQQVRIIATSNKFGGALKFINYSNRPASLVLSGEKLTKVAFSDSIYILKLQNFSACEDPNFTMWLAIKANNLKFEKEINHQKDTNFIFNIADDDELIFATSFISADQAAYNLSNLHSFTQIHQDSVNSWNKIFNLIEIQDYKKEQILTFYENLYRTFLYPMQFYEVSPEGKTIHYSTVQKKILPGKMFTNVGFWDVYRTSFPLYSLLCPQKYTEFLEGFFNNYQETGYLPRWLSPDERGMMPGTMLDVIVADAATKGLVKDELPQYFKAMIKGAETSSNDSKYGREGLEEYKTLGYVSNYYPESVNKTLDYAYSDWAISVVAKILHKAQYEAYYAKRSLNYQNLFNKDIGLMVPKTKQGNFINNFDDHDWGKGFTEGSSWQNSFNVFQDIPGLIKLYGSKQKFLAKLVELVNQSPLYNIGSYGQVIHEMREMAAQPFGQLAISNQPSFHIPYLFALAGKPHYTELIIKQMLSAFNSSAEGYPGDEDNGSMSSWYLWSALGLYPEAAGKSSYVFGIPLFDLVTIKLENGKQLSLSTENNQDTNLFVSDRNFNGKKCNQTISHQALLNGGNLRVQLSLLPQ